MSAIDTTFCLINYQITIYILSTINNKTCDVMRQKYYYFWHGKSTGSGLFLKVIIICGFMWVGSSGCGNDAPGSRKYPDSELQNSHPAQQRVAYSPELDAAITEQNILERMVKSAYRFPGDTLDLALFVLHNYPPGSYLMNNDAGKTYSVPKPAVIYRTINGNKYVIAMIAMSKADDKRLIEKTNITGYRSSYIDYDSTELGTALFYLTLFRFAKGTFEKLWEVPVPVHGGFKRIVMEEWQPKHISFIKARFYDAPERGHVDYNYFLINRLTEAPHLLMTYEGIDKKRTIANVNDDKYPDFCEYIYYNTRERIFVADSVFFVWEDSLYINTKNRSQTQKY